MGIRLRICAAFLAALPYTSHAGSADIARARAVCAGYKQQVLALEARGAGPDAVAIARKGWESSCAAVQALLPPSPYQNPAPRKPAQPTQLAAGSPPPGSVIEMRQGKYRFKVTVLDPKDESTRMEPPKTRAIGPQAPAGKPTPLF